MNPWGGTARVIDPSPLPIIGETGISIQAFSLLHGEDKKKEGINEHHHLTVSSKGKRDTENANGKNLMEGKLKKKLFATGLLVLFAAVFCQDSLAQIRETGTIHGYARDEQGEPLPGATISISGPYLIGGRKTYITDKNGYYRFPTLPVGPYTVSAELQGFGKYVREVAQLHANVSFAVDFKMKQTSVNEEILVTANTPTVDITSSSTDNMVLSDEIIMALPTPKELGSLAAYAPGIVVTQLGGGREGSYMASLGNGTGQYNKYSFDGLDVSNSSGRMSFSPDFNVVQEATVSAVGLPAEFGGYTGAVLMAISKSGSNRFSSLEEFWYNGRRWNSQNLGKYPADKFFDPADKTEKFEAGSYLDFGLQFGGKIIQDKFWYFLSGERTEMKNYPLGTSAIRTDSYLKGFLKLSYQLNPSMKMNFATSYDGKKSYNINAGPWLSYDADSTRSSPGALVNLNLTSILSKNSILDIKLGYYMERLWETPLNGLEVSSHQDAGTGLTYGNSPLVIRGQDNSLQGSVNYTHYIPKLIMGSHDLKFGAEIITSWPHYEEITPGGGAWYVDIFGDPFMKVVTTPAVMNTDQRYSTSTLFAQDSWSVTRRLTLNLGLRYDHSWYKIPTPDDPGYLYKGNSLSPRVGFSYDVLGDRKNVIKFHYGLYYDKMSKDVISTADKRMSQSYAVYLWDGTGWAYYYDISGGGGYRIDPNLKNSYIREISGSFERELFRNASLSINYFYRKAGRFLAMIASEACKWQKVTIINPGFDGIEGTSDDLGPVDIYEPLNPEETGYIITNPRKGQTEAMLDDLKWTAKGLEIIFNKRFSNRWQLQASYRYTRVTGNTGGTSSLWAVNSPNYFVNAYGEMGFMYGQPHQIKILANVLLPWDIDFGLNAQYISPATTIPAFYSTLAMESIKLAPPGKYKLQATKTLDLRIQKHFDVGKGKLSLMADIFNVLNSDQATLISSLVGSTYGKIYGVIAPTSFRVGLRFSY